MDQANPVGRWMDDHPGRQQRNNGGDAELGGFLYDPIHSISFEDGLGQDDGRRRNGGAVYGFENGGVKRSGIDAVDLNVIANALFITNPKCLAFLNAETFGQM